MLGRTSRASPQFMSISDGSWFGTSAHIERITQRSSTDSAVFAKSSLTSMPVFQYFWNAYGYWKAAPVLRSVLRCIGNSLP
jgi:hypothetical protein